MVSTLSPTAARRVYDRIGRAQDLQAFVEDRASAEILGHAELVSARAVFELGCGTGRFGDVLLTRYLPDDATYRGVDVSPVMVELARARLARFGDRARVRVTEGNATADAPSASCDRFLSNFVLDLLAEAEIERVLADAHRMLRPGGLLGLCSLTTGSTLPSRAFVALWMRIHAFNPALVGGCRPLELLRFLPGTRWRVMHHARITRLAVPLEAVVAERV
jgi:ubiquinone/menaquinone biosynthesis C-methylase UbiE